MIIINGAKIDRIISLYMTDNNGYVIYDDTEGVTRALTFTMGEVDEIKI